MNEEQQLYLLGFWRQYTLNQIKGITEENADVIPEGYSNNLRWNLGHILVSHAGLILPRIGVEVPFGKDYLESFNRGTSPGNWSAETPALDTLYKDLEEQVDLLKYHLKGRLDEQLTEPFAGLSTVGGLTGFAISHEAVHAGTVIGMKKALKIY